MNWLTLSPLEFGVLLSAAAAGAVWLYLTHLRPRHKLVSTLRFWRSLDSVTPSRRKRRIREPWALLAQLLFLLLAILALANPRWGGSSAQPRHVALIMDTSVWAQMQPDTGRSWLEQIRSEATRALDRLSPGDQVLLLRAEADAVPALPFTDNRAAVRRAILAIEPSDMVADLPRALETARAAVGGKSHPAIVYIGPAMVEESQQRRLDDFRRSLAGPTGPAANNDARLLLRAVGAGERVRNHGITRMALRRDAAQPDRWHLLVQVRNYDTQPVTARLRLAVGNITLEQHAISLASEQSSEPRVDFTWAAGGLLTAQLEGADALAADNRAVAWLPAFQPVRVAIFTSEPQLLRSVLSTNPFLRCEFLAPTATPSARPHVAIFDAGAPARDGVADHTIVFLRGAGSRQVRLTTWNTQHPAARWLRTRDITVQAAALTQRPNDIVLASSESTPVSIAREQGMRKTVVLGFDPRQSNLPLQPAFPLLLAGAIEWMTGAVEETSHPVATGEVTLSGATAASARVVSPTGDLLFTGRKGDDLHALFPRAGVYRLSFPPAGTERHIAANVPALPAVRWRIASAESASFAPRPLSIAGSDLWRWLLLLALVPLWAELWLYRLRTSGGAA